MTPRQRALDKVKEIVLGALVGYDAEVYLFGSCATGNARRSTDIDIAIDSKETLPARLISHIRDILEESAIPYDIDVVDLTSASSAIRERVHREGVVWKECKERLEEAQRAFATLDEIAHVERLSGQAHYNATPR